MNKLLFYNDFLKSILCHSFVDIVGSFQPSHEMMLKVRCFIVLPPSTLMAALDLYGFRNIM